MFSVVENVKLEKVEKSEKTLTTGKIESVLSEGEVEEPQTIPS